MAVDVLGVVAGLRGLAPWRVRLGIGSFVTMDFGNTVAVSSKAAVHGEWHLWLYMCSWRFEIQDRVIVASEDDRQRIEAALKDLEFGKVRTIDLLGPSRDLLIVFDSETRVRTSSTSSSHNDVQWKLYTPDGYCLNVYGDGSHEYTKSNEPRPRADEPAS